MTENTSILVLCASPASTPELRMECSRNSAKLVLVAMPDTPEIETWAPRVPSTNSKLTYTGWPSRPNPTGTFCVAHLVEVQRLVALHAGRPLHGAPGIGGT